MLSVAADRVVVLFGVGLAGANCRCCGSVSGFVLHVSVLVSGVGVDSLFVLVGCVVSLSAFFLSLLVWHALLVCVLSAMVG